eukprot:1091857-Pleurochrysis_carterae.AAC.1
MSREQMRYDFPNSKFVLTSYISLDLSNFDAILAVYLYGVTLRRPSRNFKAPRSCGMHCKYVCYD